MFAPVVLPVPPLQMSVLDSEGRPVPETSYGRKVHGTEPPPVPHSGYGLGPNENPGFPIPTLPIRPGGTIRGLPHNLSKEYDLSNPGTYTVQARRRDTYSESVVESNLLTITLIPAPERPKTSFTLTISTNDDTVRAGDKISLLTEVTNTSDHEISYDCAITKLDIQVRDAQGKLASLTEGGRSLRREFGTPGSPYNLLHVKPGDTMPAGGVTVQGLYDMSHPGDYTIQFLQFDDETDSWVKSNTITITVTP